MDIGGSDATLQRCRIRSHSRPIPIDVRVQVPLFEVSPHFRFRSNSISLDEHIPDLLAFHPDVRLNEDSSFQTGKIILQDKASCIPAAVLSPPASDKTVVIDATAAPGNKTTHLSALMRNRGKARGPSWLPLHPTDQRTHVTNSDICVRERLEAVSDTAKDDSESEVRKRGIGPFRLSFCQPF